MHQPCLRSWTFKNICYTWPRRFEVRPQILVTLPIYLVCCENNLSTTVSKIFQENVQLYGVPKPVRCDLGGENVKVAEYMLMKRGCNNKAIITGRSVHNQIIETLWRAFSTDVWADFIHYFTKSNQMNIPSNSILTMSLIYVVCNIFFWQ